MNHAACVCIGADGLAAKQAIQRGRRIAELADESHFGAAIHHCALCGQHFLTLFCERVDWADGDDPQTWVAAPISAEEVERLRVANVAADEDAILRELPGERRSLLNDMPKGKPASIAWITGTLRIPPHD